MSNSIERLETALAGRYRIEREIGAGGMATVYLGDDLRHGRRVAIKVLRQELATFQGAERFDREIKIAAGLNHPHIVPVHDSGAVDDLLFFVMPFSAGESLRARLTREKKLPVLTALRIGYEVADALSYAHSHGVVHRDVKPENILLESGHALVADFGIARAIAVSDAHDVAQMRLTDAGLAIGTPAYMSPEQAAVDPALDERSDIYSLGCVLYEMLVGEAPFGGATRGALALQRASAPSPDATVKRAEIPHQVSALIARTMSLAPEDRIQTASLLAEALDAAVRAVVPTVTGSTHGPKERSIAVMSFDNLSADAENEYFADGMAEDIIDALTHLDGIRVVPRTSAFAFKGKKYDLRDVANTLGVETILQGSVRRAGNRLRITVRLINAFDGYQLWSERYERDITDVFAIQDEIAQAIALRLRVMLAQDKRRLVRPPTHSLEAYEHYLRARSLLGLRGRFLADAVAQLHGALAHDDRFALAHAALAETLMLLAFYGAVRPSTVSERAKRSASRAVELDPGLAEAHMADGLCSLHFDFDHRRATATFEHARDLEPTNVTVLSTLMTFLHHLLRGRPADAISDGERAIALDPLNSTVLARLSQSHVMLGQHEQSIAYAQRAVELDVQSLLAQTALVFALGEGGDTVGAIRTAEDALARSGRHPWMLAFLSAVLDQVGDHAGAATIHGEVVARSGREYIQPSILAIISASCGNADEAIQHCMQAIDERDLVVLFFLRPGLPFSRRIRALSRFGEVRARIGWGEDGG